MITFTQILWQLLVGHALADFSLQHDPMAKGKNRHVAIDPSKIPPGQTPTIVWPYWLTAHALINGGVVFFITGSYGLSIAEAVCHWVIDFAKCENWFGINTDQALHLVCKILWSCVYIYQCAT